MVCSREVNHISQIQPGLILRSGVTYVLCQGTFGMQKAQAERDAAAIIAEAEATNCHGHSADDADAFAALMRAKVQAKSGGKGSSVLGAGHHADQNGGAAEGGSRLGDVGQNV